jgi:hypothetical protein
VLDHQATTRRLLVLKVDDSLLTVQKMTIDKTITFETILTIPKDKQQNPRKVWSFSDKGEEGFRLYIEFEGGQLVCYQIDKDSKKAEEVWKIATIQAEKVVVGEIEASDIEDEAEEEEEAKDGEADISEVAGSEKAAP